MVTQIKGNKFFERIIGAGYLSKENPLIDNFVNTKSKIASILLVSGFVLIQYLLSQFKFFLPDNPVPITMQTFGILMMGSVLGWRLGLITIFSYVLLGILGAPIFQSWNGGINYFLGATGGYIVGFFLAVPVMGFLSQRG